MNNIKDFEVTSPPSDTVSNMDFSSQADFLAVSSWDNQVRIYEVHSSGNTIPRASYAHEAPALCVSWNKDGTKIGSGGADKAVRVYDVTTGQAMQIGQHNDAVKCAEFLEQGNILATGSWDKTLKYWDLRSPEPIGTVQLPERCYTMDSKGPLLVAGLAEKHISVIDLNNPTTIFKNTTSSLKWQTRVVACFPDAKGYAIGSIEGRIGIQYVEAKDLSKNFSFKCHRDESKNVFSVNDVNFHPLHGTFSTCGSDGTFSFWDKDSRQRLKAFPKNNGQVSSTRFNKDGSIFAYAVSYDWSKGYKHAPSLNQTKIYLHAVKDDEIKPRGTKKR
ncbi:WD40 repeat-like protein [Backusella circina FSU 941]|nr:WD40 repeat-like protein [Backusella circina FSU 941]